MAAVTLDHQPYPLIEKAELEHAYQEYAGLECDERFTLEDFESYRKANLFTLEDGTAVYAGTEGPSKVPVDLTQPIPCPHPDGWTHVHWYGK